MQTIPSTGNLDRKGGDGGGDDKKRHGENFELPPLPTISKSWLANNKIFFLIFSCEHAYFNFSKQTEGSFRSISNLVAGLPKDILTSTQNYRHK